MSGLHGNTRIEESRRWAIGLMLVAMTAALAGCIYDAPLTANGTRRFDARLVGDWTSSDGKENLKVRALDPSSEARRHVRARLEDPKFLVDEPLELTRRK